MGRLVDALAEQQRRADAMTRSAHQAFQSTTQPDDELSAGDVSAASDTDTVEAGGLSKEPCHEGPSGWQGSFAW